MSGEQKIPAPRDQVWAALNDPKILKASIPGCQDLSKVGENGFEATVKAKVGPVSATFAGNVELSDIKAPNSYTISGEGKGGVAGFAKGGADIALIDDGDETLLKYAVNAQVGGKLAQIGSRLIDSTAKKMADQFFTKFSEAVVSGSSSSGAASALGVANAPGPAGSGAAAPPSKKASPKTRGPGFWLSVVGAAVVLVGALMLLGMK